MLWGNIIVSREFSTYDDLPFQICDMMYWYSLLCLVFKKDYLIKRMAFPMVFGPIVAMYNPYGYALEGGFFSFYFYTYHIIIIYIGICALHHVKFKVNQIILIHNIYFIVVAVLFALGPNLLFEANYMFYMKAMFDTPINWQLSLLIMLAATLTLQFWIYRGISVVLYQANRKTKIEVESQSSEEKIG